MQNWSANASSRSARFVAAVLAMVFACTISAPVEAQSRRNAATWYQEAIDSLDAIAPETRSYLLSWNSRTPPPAAVREIIDDLEPMYRRVHRGVDCRVCDWDVDREAGTAIVLNHLGPMRVLARTLMARAAVAMHDGRTREAIRDYEAMAALSTHAAMDEFLVSSMVSTSIGALMTSEVRHWTQVGRLDPSDLTNLRDEFAALARVDGYRVVPAIRSELDVFAGWLETEFKDRDRAGRIELFDDFGMPADDHPFVDATETEAADLFAGLDEAYADAIDAAATSIADGDRDVEALVTWEKSVEQGTYGELARFMVPSFGRAVGTMIRIADEAAAFGDLIEASASDPAVLATDASAHLREAVRLVATIEPEFLAMLAAGEARPAPADPADEASVEAHAKWLRAADVRDRIVISLELAAACETFMCDAMSVDGDSTVIPAWAGGVREALRLLEGVAIAADRAGDPGRASRLRAVSVPVAVHLLGIEMDDWIRVPAGSMLVGVETLERAVASAGWTSGEDAGKAGARPQDAGALHAALSELVDAPAALGLGVLRDTLGMTCAQALQDLRSRMEGTDSTFNVNTAVVRELGVGGRAAMVLVLERVAGGVLGPAAPPSAAQRADVERQRREASEQGEDADTVRPIELQVLVPPGYEGLVDREVLRGLEGRIPALRRAIAVDGSTPDLVFSGLDPLELRDWRRRASTVLADIRMQADTAPESTGTVRSDP